MKKERKLLIGKNGVNIALVEDLSSIPDIGKGLIGSDEPGMAEDLFEGILLRIPGYRKKFSGIINSVHMIGMRYPISVFWIYEDTIVDKAFALPGFHIYSPGKPTSAVLELPKEAFPVLDIGDILTFGNAD